jgi:hypothetical protein
VYIQFFRASQQLSFAKGESGKRESSTLGITSPALSHCQNSQKRKDKFAKRFKSADAMQTISHFLQCSQNPNVI